MIRTFKEHLIRQTLELDGSWDFILDPQNIGQSEKWQERFPQDHRSMFVPACWNNELNLFDYEGVAWYRTSFHNLQEQHVRLIFHAVLGHADVYVDGIHLGYHYGGYSPFQFDLERLSAGNHELIVRTDSTLDKLTIPTEVVDWFHYGGIIRPVELQLLPDVYIDTWRVEYELAGRDADVSITVRLRSAAAEEQQVPLSVYEGGRLIHNETVQVSAGQTSVSIKQKWSDVRLWNVGKPELYSIRVVAGQDDVIDRIGFRRIETKDHRILINGVPVYLQGVNRHEEHPEWGFAFPPKLMQKDLDIILELGCNTVRGSHYPQSKYWLDLLDEHGIVFWSEIPMWGCFIPRDTLGNTLFRDRALAMIDEMIERDYHHPCIVFWSVHNEIDTTCEEAEWLTKPLVDLVRRKDSSRLVTYATMHPLKDILLPLFDVIGINKYNGWYEGQVEGFAQLLEQFHARADALGAGDKPVLMTEFGAAGIFGDVGWEPRLFSEDYQAHVVSTALRIFKEDPRIGGTYIWQFSDVRADLKSSGTHFRDRARSFNNKGLVNEYRKPKQVYRTVRDIYRSWK
ncbi:glycoside hydrolase family 2 protein [Paenibacillus thalictri]|uniref:Beta-glucuronidase n=1 Tax=Paenibacillus thalictri TaxID=2527873 RepID=A0A4Q9DW25_9BACL|nr:glycoside hydrolase family 2 TIM barrel-domain containing protein [Paenibacillus thalictri]TBL81267.1 beta-glucuronidase [Paenibacillus thalictri]